MYHQLSLIIIPCIVLYRQFVHGYAWTSELSLLNWLFIIFLTTTLVLTTNKNKFLVFMVATSGWILQSITSSYHATTALLLLVYVFHAHSITYVLYPLLSILNPVAALTTALVHTLFSKGAKVYSIALACTGFLFTTYSPGQPHVPSVYFVIGILALTTMLLTNLRLFIISTLTCIIGILSSNELLVYAPILYTIAWYLKHLDNQRWSMPELKQITTAAIVTMILFTTITSATDIIEMEPHESTLQALNSVSAKIVIMEKHEISAKITNSDYILVRNLTIPNNDRVQQLRQDGFLDNNVFSVPYTKLIIETMKLNNATYLLYEKDSYPTGIERAVQSEEFVKVYEHENVGVYTYAN